jgi:hypothetical protein
MDLSGRPLTDNPLDQILYVDRSEELRKVLSSVERRSNVLITGPPGIGKTSLLHRVEHDLRARGYSPTFVDAAPASSVEDLLDLIRWRLNGTPAASQADVVPRPMASQDALGEAARLMRILSSLSAGASPDDRRVLLIDEPPSGEVGHTLFGRLRDEVWQLPFVWIVAVDNHERAALTRPPADSFFPILVDVGPLSDSDSIELLRKRLASSAVAGLERIVGIANGSPRRLLTLARDLVINERSMDEILYDEQKRNSILDDLGDSATLLFAFLQEHGAASASDEDLLTEMGWTRARATQVFNSLEEAGLVVGRRQKGGRRKLYELANVPE